MDASLKLQVEDEERGVMVPKFQQGGNLNEVEMKAMSASAEGEGGEQMAAVMLQREREGSKWQFLGEKC